MGLPVASVSGTMNPTPSSLTSRVTTSPMNDSVSPARVAPACRATFASASWAMRRSATSISGWSAMTLPVTVTSAGMPLSSDHSRVTPASASGSVPASSAAGIDASTDRRASARLSRARRSAFSRCRSRSAGRSCAWSAASSCVTIPIRPWAIVSWISRAMRARSSRMPASRAWVAAGRGDRRSRPARPRAWPTPGDVPRSAR